MKKIIITEAQLHNILKENEESYFDSFTSALEKARSHAESKGYVIDEEDWWNEVSLGPGRPKEGKYTRMSVRLLKNEKPQKKGLQIIVYNRGNEIKRNYELTVYIL